MTKEKIIELINNCISPHRLCRVFFKYDENYFYFFPLISNNKLFLGVEEDDFILDGYSIRRYRDVIKAETRDDIYMRMLESEGIIDSIKTQPIDISDWKAAFMSLQKLKINIIIEKESFEKCKSESKDISVFIIGRIEKIYNNFAYVRHFDADGIWQEESYRIPYNEITSITFHSRYVDTFSKYLDDLPGNFAK